jgi:hypothetical protein
MIPDIRLRQLISHFSNYRLRNEDFEFPDLLGAAYEYLIGEFADSAGKKGGEFYTPRSIVRMIVRLVNPEQHHSVYDPCVGSGGMLILAKEYIDEHGGDGTRADLCGQEANGTVWSIVGTLFEQEVPDSRRRSRHCRFIGAVRWPNDAAHDGVRSGHGAVPHDPLPVLRRVSPFFRKNLAVLS